MLPLTFLIYSLNASVSYCPNRICAIITVLVLGILPLMTSYAQEGVTASNFLSKTSNAYLPGDTLTEYQQLPKLLRVTKAASRSETTSTVRPWPSHNFFRSILSKSDNVVTKTRNRSKNVRRKSHETETKVHKNASSLHNRKGQENSTENLRPKTNLSNTKRPVKAYHVANRKKVNEKEKIENISATLIGNESQMKLNENNTRARSVAIRSEESLTNVISEVVSERKFSSPSKENHEQTMHNVKFYNNVNEKAENVTKPSELENSTINKALKEDSDEYAYINSPQVGFQYEIVVPPPTTISSLPRPSPPTSFKTTTKASLNHAPTSSGISTTLHVFYSKENDGDNNDADSSENNRNTSISTISAVTVNDTRRRVTNDDTPTTISPPLPLGSQLEESEAAAATTLVPLPSSTFPDTLYSKSNETISQNPQNTSSLLLLSPPPPTQQQQPPLQSNTHLVNWNGENITSNNKSHLPHCLKGECLEKENVSEIHTEIKKNDPWTINHNSGNDESANKASLVETSTFIPILKKEDYKLNSSSVNSLMAFPLDTSTTTIHPFFATHEWTTFSPPTQFFPHKTPPRSLLQQVQKKGAHISKIERPNNSFQKRISYNRQSTNTGDTNYHTFPRQERLRLNHTTLINRRNMFTVVKGEVTNPKIHVESRNTTSTSESNRKSSNIMKSGLPGRNPTNINTLLHDRTNQVERPSISSSILTGPDRMIFSSVSPSPPPRYTQKDNDYFDEDDAQSNLHHWIESDQGHFVTPSTELPKFTNLTWPYYFPTSDIEPNKHSQGNLASATGLGASGISSGPSSSASTALDVSINSKRKGKPSSDFNSNFEFYIPSAAADPYQNPILLGKRPTNKTAHVNYETRTKVPTAEASTIKHLQTDEQLLNYLGQNGHKSKIKQSHWGSNGLSIKPQNSHKVNSHTSQTSSIKHGEQQQENKIKQYESSMGNPKSSSTMYPSTKAPTGIPTFTIYGNGNKYQNHFFTSPSSSTLFGSTLPFDGGKVEGQSETVSFVTSKTPTNIWYKPIINHFTATVPFNGTTMLYENAPDKVFNNAFGSGIFTTTMKPPASSIHKVYVGENHDDDPFFVANKIREKTQKSKNNFSTIPEKRKPDKKSTILFKVWNLDADGKLKLENQREIPAWALQGYLIPASGTILNLQQIPAALQPLVTSALAMNKEATYSIFSTTSLPYIWKPLPILGSGLNGANDFSIITPTPTPIRPTITKTTIFSNVSPVVTSPFNPDESLFDNGSNQIKFPANQIGWDAAETEAMHNKQPISINYVLYNNPASNHGQSIILSTPTPTQIPLSQPTPVTYFPSSTITSVENIPLSAVTIKHPGSSTHSYITTTTPRTRPTNLNQEKLELLFQNYFQYFITTSTPAPTTTTSTTVPLSISLANKGSIIIEKLEHKMCWKTLLIKKIHMK